MKQCLYLYQQSNKPLICVSSLIRRVQAGRGKQSSRHKADRLVTSSLELCSVAADW